jgi:hypothetical protein
VDILIEDDPLDGRNENRLRARSGKVEWGKGFRPPAAPIWPVPPMRLPRLMRNPLRIYR